MSPLERGPPDKNNIQSIKSKVLALAGCEWKECFVPGSAPNTCYRGVNVEEQLINHQRYLQRFFPSLPGLYLTNLCHINIYKTINVKLCHINEKKVSIITLHSQPGWAPCSWRDGRGQSLLAKTKLLTEHEISEIRGSSLLELYIRAVFWCVFHQIRDIRSSHLAHFNIEFWAYT